jgi:hypothetical protein
MPSLKRPPASRPGASGRRSIPRLKRPRRRRLNRRASPSLKRPRRRRGGRRRVPSAKPCSVWSGVAGPRSIPVGWGQTRRGYVVTCELPCSRAFAGALVSRRSSATSPMGWRAAWPGSAPCTTGWSGTARVRSPRGAARPRASSPSAAGSRSAGSSSTRATARPRARSSAATASYTTTSRPAAGSPTSSTSSTSSTAGASASTPASTATTRAVVSERLAEERKRMRPLPKVLPDTDRRFVTRVAPQPYLGFDRNDYSLDPRLVGRRVEVRASDRADRGLPRHGRARLPPRARLRRRPHRHRPRPPGGARSPAGRAQARRGATPTSSAARLRATTS